jgi:hypothetical protein
MTLASNEGRRFYAGRVLLEAATCADAQDVCPDGYQMVIKRRDGVALLKTEFPFVITNLSWTIDGEVCHIDPHRISPRDENA